MLNSLDLVRRVWLGIQFSTHENPSEDNILGSFLKALLYCNIIMETCQALSMGVSTVFYGDSLEGGDRK